ncbi:MAG: hypothetical protein J1E61_10295 [Lachnospiraceae bacterium]|nr:hypothetical protein [Lachnospiraceae bacterium]
MLYEIDESCLSVLETGDNNCIHFFEQLALDRKKCKNIVIAKRIVFEKLSKMNCFSDYVRTIYRILGNRGSEYKLILSSTKKYCKIVAESTGKSLIHDGGHDIIILPIREASDKDYGEKTIMITENQDEISFYKIIGHYYMNQKKIGNISIDFDERNGGGSTIAPTLEKVISEGERTCLCIVDSDKKYSSASNGSTMENVKKVIKNLDQTYFEVLLLEIHEIENLIPISILENIVKSNNLSEQGLSFMKYLISINSQGESPVFYFDVKKGIPSNLFFLPEDAQKEQVKKYNKGDKYRRYWEKYINTFGVDIESKRSQETIIDGICVKVLKHAIEYLDKTKKEGKAGIVEIEPYIQNMWMEIGEKIYCWGCVGHRIAI